MLPTPPRWLATFNDRYVEVECDSDDLAQLVSRWMADLTTPPRRPAASRRAAGPLLRVTFEEHPQGVEASDSIGHREQGTLAHVVRHARLWIAGAFVAADPQLIWVQGAAATRADRAVVMTGPAGAGKTALAVQLMLQGWTLLAEDFVAVEPERCVALPLPFHPAVRAEVDGFEDNLRAFLARPKTHAALPVGQVDEQPVAVGAIVFPQFAPSLGRPRLTPVAPLAAAFTLTTQRPRPRPGAASLDEVFALARQVPAFCLTFGDAAGAAEELTDCWSRMILRTAPFAE